MRETRTVSPGSWPGLRKNRSPQTCSLQLLSLQRDEDTPTLPRRLELPLILSPSHHTSQDTSPSTRSLHVTLFSGHFHNAAQTANNASMCMGVLATLSIKTSLGGSCLHSTLRHTPEQSEDPTALRSTGTKSTEKQDHLCRSG